MSRCVRTTQERPIARAVLSLRRRGPPRRAIWARISLALNGVYLGQFRERSPSRQVRRPLLPTNVRRGRLRTARCFSNPGQFRARESRQNVLPEQLWVVSGTRVGFSPL